jgi:predicted transcriptional regulator
MYTLGVNNDGKIRKEAYDKVKKELTEVEDEKCLELVEEMAKFVELKPEDVVRNSRPNPAERAARQAETKKKLEESGVFGKDEISRMVAAVR